MIEFQTKEHFRSMCPIIPNEEIYIHKFVATYLVCINDKDKPLGIPDEEWIITGLLYTPIEIKTDPLGNQAVHLLEVKINNDRFAGYNMDRFIPYPHWYN